MKGGTNVIIGLTGSSGSGKSTVAKMFCRAGYRIVDCDKISHDIDAVPEYINAVRAHFGNGAFDANGKIDRRALGKIVFADKEKLSLLTAISHPIIKKKVMEQLSTGGKIVIDAPLLFESGLDSVCDLTVGVISGKEMRAKRVAERDGLDVSDAAIRTSSQKNDDFYREKCVYIIENEGSISDLEKNVSKMLAELEK